MTAKPSGGKFKNSYNIQRNRKSFHEILSENQFSRWSQTANVKPNSQRRPHSKLFRKFSKISPKKHKSQYSSLVCFLLSCELVHADASAYMLRIFFKIAFGEKAQKVLLSKHKQGLNKHGNDSVVTAASHYFVIFQKSAF